MIRGEFSVRSELLLLMACCALWAYPATTESATCWGHTSCLGCHEKQGEMKVMHKGQYHIQHNFSKKNETPTDYCVFCHSGELSRKTKAEAHQGLRVKPLSDVSQSCSGCHPDDFRKRANQYVTQTAP